MIEHILVMCAITVTGGWDCSEHWLVFYYPEDVIVPVRSPYGIYASGWAVWDVKKYSVCDWKEDIHPDLCNFKWIAVDGTVSDECYDYRCYPPLWHEIRHLACECGWHNNMTATRNMEAFR